MSRIPLLRLITKAAILAPMGTALVIAGSVTAVLAYIVLPSGAENPEDPTRRQLRGTEIAAPTETATIALPTTVPLESGPSGNTRPVATAPYNEDADVTPTARVIRIPTVSPASSTPSRALARAARPSPTPTSRPANITTSQLPTADVSTAMPPPPTTAAPAPLAPRSADTGSQPATATTSAPEAPPVAELPVVRADTPTVTATPIPLAPTVIPPTPTPVPT